MGEPLNPPLRIGIVGAGAISAQYLQSFERLPSLRLTAVADLDPARAAAVAEPRPGVRSCPVAELVGAEDVDLVLNLTIPAAHAEVAAAAVAAGKSVYGEKPLAATTAEAQRVLAAAADAGVRVGCAPDTVLGTGIQTARKAVDDGLIGTPVAATAVMLSPGHERWHPNPDFYYQPGGGPLFDMGPYYVTALITLLGGIRSVTGRSTRSRDERTIGNGPRAGERFGVSVDTHVTGVLEHTSGVLSTLVMSFDTVSTHSVPIEVHGTDGSLAVPDPNHFAGPTALHELGGDGWRELPVSAGYTDGGRGYGIADLAATPAGDEPRAGGRLALHVLDVMESLLRSAAEGRTVTVDTGVDRPSAVPLTP